MNDHAHTDLCDDLSSMSCHRVVEQHQAVPEDDVPQFEIELRFITTSDISTGRKPGWKYTLVWGDAGKPGVLNISRGYGYPNKEKAKVAAEAEARALTLSMLPTERYSYTPEF